VRKLYCILLLSGISFFTFAQNVASVNGKPISSKEFMWVYKKNHGATHAAYHDLADYLHLYINFKLKVADARANGLDSDTAYRKEISGYENALKTQRKASPKNAEYNFVVNEYREGVLMFNISEKKIWSKISDDEPALMAYYHVNNANYKGKAYDEVRAQVIADYQQRLEDEWINTLKTKYPVKINEEELKKLAKP